MYAKFINEKNIDLAPYEKDGIVNYNSESNVEMLLKDGYKPYELEPQPLDIYYPEVRFREEKDKIVGYWIEKAIAKAHYYHSEHSEEVY